MGDSTTWIEMGLLKIFQTFTEKWIDEECLLILEETPSLTQPDQRDRIKDRTTDRDFPRFLYERHTYLIYKKHINGSLKSYKEKLVMYQHYFRNFLRKRLGGWEAGYTWRVILSRSFVLYRNEDSFPSFGRDKNPVSPLSTVLKVTSPWITFLLVRKGTHRYRKSSFSFQWDGDLLMKTP